MRAQFNNSIVASRKPDQDHRRLIAVIGAVVAICATMNSVTPVCGQVENLTEIFNTDVGDPSVPFPQLPQVEHAIVIGETVFICWPRSLVGQATLTAVDLQSFQTLWTRTFDDYDIKTFRRFGDLLYCGIGDHAPSRYDGPNPNLYELSAEYLLQSDTGKQLRERSIVKSYWRRPVIGDSYLVTDEIIGAAGRPVAELKFVWHYAKIHQGKLYSIGDPDDVSESLGNLTRTRTRTHRLGQIDQSSAFEFRDWQPVLRVTDLVTGVTELTMEIPTPSAISDMQGLAWSLVAAKDDRLVLQVYQPDQNSTNKGQLICYDFRRGVVVWKQAVPCEIGHVRLSEKRASDQQSPAPVLECQCRCRPLTNHESEHGTFDRQPLIIDWETGNWRPDPQWRDPASMLAWHIGFDSISHLAMNDRFIVAISNQAQMLAIDSSTGQLIWRRDVASSWPPFSETLDELLVAPTLGGIEVTDVATGRGRRIYPEHVGLQIIPTLKLPRQLPMDQDSVPGDARNDWFYDRSMMMMPAVPLIAWGLYVSIRRRRGAAKTTGAI